MKDSCTLLSTLIVFLKLKKVVLLQSLSILLPLPAPSFHPMAKSGHIGLQRVGRQGGWGDTPQSPVVWDSENDDRSPIRSSVLSQLAAVDNFAKTLTIQGVCFKPQSLTKMIISTHSSCHMGMINWTGFLVDRVLFIKPPLVSNWTSNPFDLHTCIHYLLELVDNSLDCSRVIVCLDSSINDLSSILKTLGYACFERVHPNVYSFGQDYVLCGLEL
ncbi:hypothetical protein O5D80_008216 [Batrachochytrium dendrobatidis]|nr:hypothetical protein O5D80_008216 [Batrachochytrium dendrobatidis]